MRVRVLYQIRAYILMNRNYCGENEISVIYRVKALLFALKVLKVFMDCIFSFLKTLHQNHNIEYCSMAYCP